MTWVLMPHVNNPEATRLAVEDALFPTQTSPTQVLLIANGATSEAQEGGFQLAAEHPDKVKLWHYTPSLPLAALWNRALQFAWDSGVAEALVVNNDVRLHPQLVEALKEARVRTGAWFISACNVGDAWGIAKGDALLPLTPSLLSSRGGPDFSCFLITQECHRWFQFDEHFSPAYFEDNDYHRRLQLAGFGDRIFSLPIPYFHEGSGTLKADPTFRESWGPKFEGSQRHYVAKWGGLPHHETYSTPFGLQLDSTRGLHERVIYFGQGRQELTLEGYQKASAYCESANGR